jgi:two-component system, NarL family, sensor histidine kinase DesK
MSGATVRSGAGPAGTARHARLLAAAVTVIFLVPGCVYAVIGWQGGGGTGGPPVLVLAFAVAIGLIHARHGLAAVRGHRPAAWPWTALAQLALIYAPLPFWSFNWASTQVFAVASALLLLRGPVRLVAAALPLVVMTAWTWHTAYMAGAGSAELLLASSYWWFGLVLGGVGLWGAVRFVRTLDDLAAARAELAEAAVGHERLRVSRDLHDLLGQSLSAVSLKGDLALALLRKDPAAARAEIESLTAVARDALHDVRAVTHDEHTVSLRTELDGAAALLTAAGIRFTGHRDPAPTLTADVDALLAWAVREGVTNVLRHSDATTCAVDITLDTVRETDVVHLRITNDRPRARRGDGNGLPGLRQRAAPLGATVTARGDGDRFTLQVTVPRTPVGHAADRTRTLEEIP